MAAPADTPVTIPEDEPIVATPVDPETHVPPPASLKVVVDELQREAVPEIAAGNGSTVIVSDIRHPVPSV